MQLVPANPSVILYAGWQWHPTISRLPFSSINSLLLKTLFMYYWLIPSFYFFNHKQQTADRSIYSQDILKISLFFKPGTVVHARVEKCYDQGYGACITVFILCLTDNLFQNLVKQINRNSFCNIEKKNMNHPRVALDPTHTKKKKLDVFSNRQASFRLDPEFNAGRTIVPIP